MSNNQLEVGCRNAAQFGNNVVRTREERGMGCFFLLSRVLPAVTSVSWASGIPDLPLTAFFLHNQQHHQETFLEARRAHCLELEISCHSRLALAPLQEGTDEN